MHVCGWDRDVHGAEAGGCACVCVCVCRWYIVIPYTEVGDSSCEI